MARTLIMLVLACLFVTLAILVDSGSVLQRTESDDINEDGIDDEDQHVTANATDSNKDNDYKRSEDDEQQDENDLSGGSRLGVGGDPVVGLNQHSLMAWNDEDNHISGHAIRPSPFTAIVHEDSCGSKNNPSQIVTGPANSIDVKRNLDGMSGYMCGKLVDKLGDTKLSWRALENPNPRYDVHQKLLESFKAPTFQHDPSVTDNCHLETYTASSMDKEGGPVGSTRQLSRFDVYMNCAADGCHGGSAQAKVKRSSGNICHHDGDLGAPIYCGQNKALSFIVSGMGSECSVRFSALRVADYYEKLTSDESINRPPPTAPIQLSSRVPISLPSSTGWFSKFFG